MLNPQMYISVKLCRCAAQRNWWIADANLFIFQVETKLSLISGHNKQGLTPHVVKMKLLTHNMLTSHVKGVKNGYPLRILVSPVS